MERELIGQVPSLGDLYGVDLADQVGDRSVGRGELLAETLLTANPLDRAAVTLRGDQFPGVVRDGVVGVVQDLRASDYRQLFIKQLDEAAHEPGLALAALAEENDVVARDEGVLEGGQDRAVVAHQAPDDGLASRNAPSSIRSHLLFNRA